MLDNLFLLFDDLILFRVIWMGLLNTGRYGGVQRAHTISARGQVIRELSICTVTLCWTLLTYITTQYESQPSKRTKA